MASTVTNAATPVRPSLVSNHRWNGANNTASASAQARAGRNGSASR